MNCWVNNKGKKQCNYWCDNGEFLEVNGASWGQFKVQCTCPRWNGRNCGWSIKGMKSMFDEADVAGFTCPDAPTTFSTTTTANPAG